MFESLSYKNVHCEILLLNNNNNNYIERFIIIGGVDGTIAYLLTPFSHSITNRLAGVH